MDLIMLGSPGRGDWTESEELECALCGDGERLTFIVIGRADTAVCVDSRSCVLRALAGVTV